MPENNQSNKADHLKGHRWQKGQSGNPGGRPKKLPISDAYSQQMEMPISKLPKVQLEKMLVQFPWLNPESTMAEAIAASRGFFAMGDQYTANSIRDSIEGSPVQRHEISGPDKKDIRIKVTFVKGDDKKA